MFLKIISIILFCLCFCCFLLLFTHEHQKEENTPLGYFNKNNGGFICIFLILFGIQLFQLGKMCWQDSAPYILFTDEEGTIATYWVDSVKTKFIIASVAGLIYYIVKFFMRKSEHQESAKENNYLISLERNEKMYKDKYHHAEKNTEKLVYTMMENMPVNSSITIVDKYNNIYSIIKYIQHSEYGDWNDYSIKQLYKESEQSFLSNITDSINIKSICESFVNGEIQLVTNGDNSPLYDNI